MTLRSFRERILQTLAFEIGGICVVTPLYAVMFGAPPGQALTIVVAMSVAAVIWTPLHNTLFDLVDLRLSGRVASDRPQRWRIVHATSHEITVMVLTLPILMVIGGLSFWEALVADLGFSVIYAVYAYVFHMLFDALRPVIPAPQHTVAKAEV